MTTPRDELVQELAYVLGKERAEQLADAFAHQLAEQLRVEAAVCRRMETRTCPPSYNGLCGDRPCARFESDDPTPWLDTAQTLAPEHDYAKTSVPIPRPAEVIEDERALREYMQAADEDAQRTARRKRLGHFLGQAERGSLVSPGEGTMLRQLVEAEMREADAARARADQAEELQRIAHETSNRSEAERARWEERATRAQQGHDQRAAVLKEVLAAFVHKVEGYRIPRVRAEADVATLEKWRSVLAPVVAPPWWQQLDTMRAELEEAQAAIKRVRETTVYMRSVTRTWDPAADLIDQALAGNQEFLSPGEGSARPEVDDSGDIPSGVVHPKASSQASAMAEVDKPGAELEAAQAAIERVKAVGSDLEYAATGIGLSEPAREVLRDAARRIRTALQTPSYFLSTTAVVPVWRHNPDGTWSLPVGGGFLTVPAGTSPGRRAQFLFACIGLPAGETTTQPAAGKHEAPSSAEGTP